MRFYQSCFGGDLELQYLKDTIDDQVMCRKMMTLILYASLTTPDFVVTGSDMVAHDGLKNGTRVSLLLDLSERTDAYYVVASLSSGTADENIADIWNSNEWISFTDKYGVQWILKN
jgi:PhnB protein